MKSLVLIENTKPISGGLLVAAALERIEGGRGVKGMVGKTQQRFTSITTLLAQTQQNPSPLRRKGGQPEKPENRWWQRLSCGFFTVVVCKQGGSLEIVPARVEEKMVIDCLVVVLGRLPIGHGGLGLCVVMNDGGGDVVGCGGVLVGEDRPGEGWR
jgi:hypothetical protein